jgi:hypothetical protein
LKLNDGMLGGLNDEGGGAVGLVGTELRPAVVLAMLNAAARCSSVRLVPASDSFSDAD